jgi:transcriptional regulator with XRE-family HTH domain
LKSIYTDDYMRLLRLLIEARKNAKLTQHEVAARLVRPQSFVSKYERGERRLDVVEYFRVSRILGADPYELLRVMDESGEGQASWLSST